MNKKTLLIAAGCAAIIWSSSTAQTDSGAKLGQVKQKEVQSTLYAQYVPPGPCPEPMSKQRMNRQHWEKVEARVRTMKIWKMTEELQLSEEQATRFFPLMNEFEANQDKIEENKREIFQKLGDLVWDPKADNKEITQLLDQIEKYDLEKIELRKKFRKDAAAILEPAQIGKLVLFNHRFPAIMREMVRELDEREQPGPQRPPDRRGW